MFWRYPMMTVLWLAYLLVAAPALAEPAQNKAGSAKADSPKSDAGKSDAGKSDGAKRAAENPPAPKFLRVLRDKQGEPQAMETSIVRYVPADGTRDGLVVDLIGAVHVGDKRYYEKLNKAFDQYDVLLYELVAPEGTKIPKGGGQRSGHPVSAIQQGMKNMLDLEFQLEQVDYTKKHFVHADMSPEQFAKSMKDRGESFLQLFFRMMGTAIAQQSGRKGSATEAEMLIALFSKDRAFHLKRAMAQQFEDLGGMMAALEGPEGSTLVTERNKAALAVMKKEIAAGKKRIGIFYGAGHMNDMEGRLQTEFALREKSVQWVEAWNLRPPTKGTGDNKAATKKTAQSPVPSPQSPVPSPQSLVPSP